MEISTQKHNGVQTNQRPSIEGESDSKYSNDWVILVVSYVMNVCSIAKEQLEKRS